MEIANCSETESLSKVAAGVPTPLLHAQLTLSHTQKELIAFSLVSVSHQVFVGWRRLSHLFIPLPISNPRVSPVKPSCKMYPAFELFLPCGSAGKESACNVEDLGSIAGLGRSPEEGKGYPLQYSGLENSLDCIVHGVAKGWTQLSDFRFHFTSLRLPHSVGSCLLYPLAV